MKTMLGALAAVVVAVTLSACAVAPAGGYVSAPVYVEPAYVVGSACCLRPSWRHGERHEHVERFVHLAQSVRVAGQGEERRK